MPPELTPEAEEAIHKAKNAAQAVEAAREAQITKAVEDTAVRTKQSVLEALIQIFGNETEDPQQMKVLVRRIPILCSTIDAMHEDIAQLVDNQRWVTRTAIGSFITIVTGAIGTLIIMAIKG